MTAPIQQYFHVRTSDLAVRANVADQAWMQGWLRNLVLTNGGPDLDTRMAVRDLPTARWGIDGDIGTPFDLVVALTFTDDLAATALRGVLETGAGGDYRGMGADPMVAPFGDWRPGTGRPVSFGTERHAAEAVGFATHPSSGRDVNLVVIDTGLDPRLFDASNIGGGWAAQQQGPSPALMQPWAADAGHGCMVARAALTIAPRAKLWDVPLLPPAIGDLPQFLSDAQTAFLKTFFAIGRMILKNQSSDRWVLVNAWGIYDRRAEPVLGRYTENDVPYGHPFNRLMVLADALGFDVVFAAGNAGPFFPHWRCGPQDWGAGHGIWGANAHAKVLSVGAVRSDRIWLGYSSQGPGPRDLAGLPPGQEMLTDQKPDVCAPSNFTDSGSASFRYTGTSAACGVAAGVVAALRTDFGPAGPGGRTPGALRHELRRTASLRSSVIDPALGFGVVDVKAARAALG